MVKMENNINEYKYGDSVEDLKLKAFVEHATPKDMDSNAINQKTFMKIRYGILGQTMNIPGRSGRKISSLAYSVARRIIGFN